MTACKQRENKNKIISIIKMNRTCQRLYSRIQISRILRKLTGQYSVRVWLFRVKTENGFLSKPSGSLSPNFPESLSCKRNFKGSCQPHQSSFLSLTLTVAKRNLKIPFQCSSLKSSSDLPDQHWVYIHDVSYNGCLLC